MEKIIQKTQDFLMKTLKSGKAPEHEVVYRYEHSLRVANIGIQLAKLEKANPETVVLGCLLHDLGKFEGERNIDHGRISAVMAKPFLEELQLPQKQIEDICYAIACHVDGKAGYEYDDILEAAIVTDADNIDRFSASKIKHAKLWELNDPVDTQTEIHRLEKRLARMIEMKSEDVLETKSGNELFVEKLDLNIYFMQSLLKDLEQTKSVHWHIG